MRLPGGMTSSGETNSLTFWLTAATVSPLAVDEEENDSRQGWSA